MNPINITSLKINNLLEYNSKLYHTYNYLLVTSNKPNHDDYGAVSPATTAESGIYTVNIVVNTIDTLQWQGDYKHSNTHQIKNGVNTFDIKIDKHQTDSFKIGIYGNVKHQTDSLKIGADDDNKYSESKFIIYDFSIVKKKSNSSNIIDIIHKIEDDIFGSLLGGKKNILIIVDYQGGTFYNIATMIKKYLNHKYNILIDAYINLSNYEEKYHNVKFDIVIKFWYEHYNVDPFDVYPNAKKILCVYDYIYWNKDINQISSDRYQEIFVSNINRSDYILYSCPIIKDLIIQKYGSDIGRKLHPAFDGYNSELFHYCKYNGNNNRLRVGWVGNSLNIYKNLQQIKDIIQNVGWIELKIQDKNSPIMQNQMINFYNDIDVIVSLSTAEGTPNPILEASACGRAWISTDVGIVKLLNDAVSSKLKPGIIIKDGSELLEKLAYLHKNRSVMEEMGLIGSIYCKEAFTWEKQVKQFDAVFNLA